MESGVPSALPYVLAAALVLAGISVGLRITARSGGTVVTESDKALCDAAASALDGDAGRRLGVISAAPVASDEGVPALAQAPFDTAIRYQLTHDALMFRIPRSPRGFFVIAFLAVWLAGWTTGIFVAALGVVSGVLGLAGVKIPSQFIDAAGQPGAFVFLAGWLALAFAGETFALRALSNQLVRALGEQFVICTRDKLICVASFLSFKAIAAYDAAKVQNVTARDRIRSATAYEEGLQFDYGRRKISIFGLSQTEAAWVAASIAQYRASAA